MTVSVRVILNPVTHGGKGERILPSLSSGLEERGFRADVRRTEGPGHAVELAAGAVGDGVDRVLVVGGDGTIHEVANGLLGAPGASRPAMAVLPLGTGNDFHRMVQLDRSVGGALEVLERGRAVPFDVGQVSWEGGSRYFVNLLGVGIDVAILQRRGLFTRLPGKLQYLASLMAVLGDFRPMRVHVELADGEQLDRDSLITAVTIGPSVAGGIPLTPEASPFDGVLDFCLVERLNVGRILYYLPKVLRGTHGGLPAVHLRRVKTMRFALQDGSEFRFQMDGEVEGSAATWLEVSLAQVRLPVMVPAEVATEAERLRGDEPSAPEPSGDRR